MSHKEAMNHIYYSDKKTPENFPELKYLNYFSLVN